MSDDYRDPFDDYSCDPQDDFYFEDDYYDEILDGIEDDYYDEDYEHYCPEDF